MFKGQVLIWALTAMIAKAQDCSAPADLFFVIDGSDSMTDEDFANTKAFVVEVLDHFDVQKGSIHVGANVFGNSVYDRIRLYGPTRSMYILFQARLASMRRMSDPGTSTYLALEEMRTDFRNEGRNVSKIGVVITDGKSKNVTRTSEQAQLARDEGINMVAVGVGVPSTIFLPELRNIASSPRSVFTTQDISSIRQVITEAITDYICPPPTTTTSTTTTTPATTTAAATSTQLVSTTAPVTTTAAVTSTQSPTAPSTTADSHSHHSTPDSSNVNNNAFDCPDCMIVGGHGFWSHPTSCKKYLEITEDADGTRKYTVRECRDGLFWDQYFTTCRLPENVNCVNDPCKTLPIISYDVKDVCSAYVLCAGGRSVRACCPIRERYVAGQGCVTDPTCTDTCGGTDDTHLISPQECDKRSHPTDADYYIQSPGGGHGDIVRRCAPGTLFNEASCTCDILDTSPQTDSLADCNPTGNFTFDSNSRGNFAHDNVEFANGEALYNGAGYINLYRFANDDFGERLVIRIKATPSSQGSVLQALFTNCVDAVGQRFSLAILLERFNGNNVVFFTETDLADNSTLTTMRTIRVPYTPDAVNEIIYIYDGSYLTGVVNGVKVQAALRGNILMRRSGLVIGAGSELDYYTGSVDEVQIYKECYPSYAEAERTP